jgi:voltage-gated potassium channel
MSADGHPQTDEERKSLRARATARYGLVLVLLLATFVLLICGLTSPWARVGTVALVCVTLLAAFAAAQVGRRLQHIARIAVALSMAISLAALWSDSDLGVAAVAIVNSLLVVVAPIAIASSIIRRRVIDGRAVLGALCIYVLLGLLWGFVYTAIGAIANEPFFVQTAHATTSEYTYFSFITMTTVGYGDFTAGNNLGRGCAAMEALVGQIYLVTVVALLVSNLGRGRDRPVDA